MKISVKLRFSKIRQITKRFSSFAIILMQGWHEIAFAEGQIPYMKMLIGRHVLTESNFVKSGYEKRILPVLPTITLLIKRSVYPNNCSAGAFLKELYQLL